MDESRPNADGANIDPGEPIGITDDGWQVIDPGSLGNGDAGTGSDSGNSYTGKRRGRKPGSRNATSGNTASDKTASLRGLDLKDILLSAHSMLAIALKRPALALEPAEAAKLEDAMKRVWRHYPLNVSQKQVDMAFAATVVVEIYGTRIAAAYMDNSAAPAKQADPAVLPFMRPLV